MPPEFDRTVRELTAEWLPTSFWAFHQQYYGVYKRYAEIQLDDPPWARQVVQDVMKSLAVHWNWLMAQESPRTIAWGILRHTIAERLREIGREPTFTANAAFRRASLETFRDKFAALESDLGLYAAIARLPERQYDVIVLQYVLDTPPDRVATIMGVSPATVRAHRRRARARLARDLGLDITEDPNDDQDE
ncbi:sigma-70 family RNA polymerase sigma factor [Streptomyces mayteni]